ncbi:MAG: hypothetical protein Q8Q09_29805 [Deltaproteobacteria bacterium]|nr:hypothetical protein [Deltaproteobacteria bacterium]
MTQRAEHYLGSWVVLCAFALAIGGKQFSRAQAVARDVVRDGEVAVRPEQGTPPCVHFWTATARELGTLRGVGPVRRAKILQWRSAHAVRTPISQLREIRGLGPVTVARLMSQICPEDR